jgi:hypothetical protein
MRVGLAFPILACHTQGMKIIDEAGRKPSRVQMFRISDGRMYRYGTRKVLPSGAEIPGTARLWPNYKAAEQAFTRQSRE